MPGVTADYGLFTSGVFLGWCVLQFVEFLGEESERRYIFSITYIFPKSCQRRSDLKPAAPAFKTVKFQL